MASPECQSGAALVLGAIDGKSKRPIRNYTYRSISRNRFSKGKQEVGIATKFIRTRKRFTLLGRRPDVAFYPDNFSFSSADIMEVRVLKKSKECCAVEVPPNNQLVARSPI